MFRRLPACMVLVLLAFTATPLNASSSDFYGACWLFRRGDANLDGATNIADAVFLLAYLFTGGNPPGHADAADVNDDGVLNIADPLALLGYLFQGSSLPPPHPEPGIDPTPDLLHVPDPSDPTGLAPCPAPHSLLAVSGNLQTAPAGTQVDDLVVAVLDQSDAGIPGIEVTFIWVEGDGVLSCDVAVTDATGHAAVGCVLGAEPHVHQVRASLPGFDDVVFVLIGTAPVPPSPPIELVEVPFTLPLHGDSPALETLTLRSVSARQVWIEAVAILPIVFDPGSPEYAASVASAGSVILPVGSLPVFPLLLGPGEEHGFEVEALFDVLGFHRVAFQVTVTDGLLPAADWTFALDVLVQQPAMASISQDLELVGFPGQTLSGTIQVQCHPDSPEPLLIQDVIAPPAIDLGPLLLPMELVPGQQILLNVSATPPEFLPQAVAADVLLATNQARSFDGSPFHSPARVRLTTLSAARLDVTLLPPQSVAPATLLVEPYLATEVFTVVTHDPGVVRFEQAGQRVDELSGLSAGATLQLRGEDLGFTTVSIVNEATGFVIGACTVTVGASTTAARLIRRYDDANSPWVPLTDLLQFVSLPDGVLLAEHDLGPDALLRGMDLVPFESAGNSYAVLQLRTGEVRVYDRATGQAVHTFTTAATGLTGATPYVDPVMFDWQDPQGSHAGCVVVDNVGNMACLDLDLLTVHATASLPPLAGGASQHMGEDIDLVVHGGSGTFPLSVFALTIQGNAYALGLPDLDCLEFLGSVEFMGFQPAARTAVDPVARGERVVFAGGAGRLMFVRPKASAAQVCGMGRFELAATVNPADYGDSQNWDVSKAEIDLQPTEDGEYWVYQAAAGHAYVFDKNGTMVTVDPSLEPPVGRQAVLGVDPCIARYVPGAPLASSRVVLVYHDATARIYSLDGTLRWTYSNSPDGGTIAPELQWTQNINVLVSEPYAILRDSSKIRFINLDTGMLFDPAQSTLHPGAMVYTTHIGEPVNGVDPVIVSGRMVEVLRNSLTGQAEVVIYELDPALLGQYQRLPLPNHLAPTADVDLAYFAAGGWFLLQDRVGNFVTFTADAQVLVTNGTGYSATRSITGVDSSLLGGLELAHPDEDWVAPSSQPLLPEDPDIDETDDPEPPPDSEPPPSGPTPGAIQDDLPYAMVQDSGPSGGPGPGEGGSSPGVACRAPACICVGQKFAVPITQGCVKVFGPFGTGLESVPAPPGQGGNNWYRGTTGGVAFYITVNLCDPGAPCSVYVNEIHFMEIARVTVTPLGPSYIPTGAASVVIERQCGSMPMENFGGPTDPCLLVLGSEPIEVTIDFCTPHFCGHQKFLHLGREDSVTGLTQVPHECLRYITTENGEILYPPFIHRENLGGDCESNGLGTDAYAIAAQCSDIPTDDDCNRCTTALGSVRVQSTSLDPIQGPSEVEVGQFVEFHVELGRANANNCMAPECAGEFNTVIDQWNQAIVWEVTSDCGPPITGLPPGTHIGFSAACTGSYTITASLPGTNCSRSTTLHVVLPYIAVPDDQEPAEDPHAVGDPVFTHSGELLQTVTDVFIPSRGIPFTWVRRYKSRVRHAGPLGNNWDFNYNEHLRFETDGVSHYHLFHHSKYLLDCDGDGVADDAPCGNPGSLAYLTPPGYFTRLRRLDNGTFALRAPDGIVHYFHGQAHPHAGKLARIEDAQGNALTFAYDVDGRLSTITDTMQRIYTVHWSPQGRIAAVEDFAGRVVTYEYYAFSEVGGGTGNLMRVTTPTTQDAPTGRTTAYRYLPGYSPTELIGNLTAVIRPREYEAGVLAGLPIALMTPSVAVRYGVDPLHPSYDRVLSLTEGGTNASEMPAGGTYEFYYYVVDPPPVEPRSEARTVLIVDRVGNMQTYHFSGAYKLIKRRVYTGRVATAYRSPYPLALRSAPVRELPHWQLQEFTQRPDLYPYPADGFAHHPIPGLGRPGPEPDFYEWRFEYNDNDLLTREQFPNGDSVTYEYASVDSPNPHERRNVSRKTFHAAGSTALDPNVVPDAASVSERSISYTYEPWTNQVSTVTDERGVTLQYFFDYQELQPALVDPLLTSWGISRPPAFLLADQLSEVPGGDLNGDGLLGPMRGLLVRARQPDTLVSSASGATHTQHAFTQHRYNALGQLVSVIDEEGAEVTLVYHPERDPEGDGILNPVGDAVTGGYLHRKIYPEGRQEIFDVYHLTGRPLRVADGRGVVTEFVRNARGQVLEERLASEVELALVGAGNQPPAESAVRPTGYVRQYQYDANDNLRTVLVKNVGAGSSLQNPWFETRFEHDILDQMVREEREVLEGVFLAWHYSYDRNGNLIQVRKPEGNADAWSYDERDLLDLQIAGLEGAGGPGGGSGQHAYVRHHYDANGHLRFFVDGEDNDLDGLPECTEYQYDGWNWLRAVIDPAGQRTDLRYNLVGRATTKEVRGTLGGPTPRRIDFPAVQQPGMQYPILRRLRYGYDERHRMVTEEVFISGPYEPGRATVEGPLGGSVDGYAMTLVEYDRCGRVVRLTNDRGNDRVMAYNALGELRTVSSASGPHGRSTVEAFRDRAGNVFRSVRTELRDDGGTETFTSYRLHDALNRPVRITGPSGESRYLAYDSRGLLTVATDAKGPVLAGGDPYGLVTGVAINAPGNAVRFLHDSLGRLQERASDLRLGGARTDLDSGFLEVVQDPALSPDPLFLDMSTDPDGIVRERVVYDGNSRVVQRLDDRSNPTTFEYDARDQVVRQVNADGSDLRYVYDRDHHLVRVTDARQVVRNIRYDGLGRRIEVLIDASGALSPVGGTTISRVERDGLGRPTLLHENNDPADPSDDSTLIYRYDSLLNAIAEDQQIGADLYPVTRVHDTVGNVLTTVYPGDTELQCVYDHEERLSQIVRWMATGSQSQPLCTLTYDGPARLAGRSVPGATTHVEYDTSARPVELTTMAGPALVVGRRYQYDRNSMRVQERFLEPAQASGPHNGRTVALDSLGRVVEVSPATIDAQDLVQGMAAVAERHRFSLDGAGNWLSLAVPGSPQIDLAYGAMNEVTHSDQQPLFAYDDNGNRASDDVRNYRYDAFERLIEVDDGTTRETYAYDANDRRILTRVYQGPTLVSETRFVHDRDHLIQEWHRDGLGAWELVAENFHGRGVDNLVARWHVAAGLYWLHTDAANSTLAATDDTGQVLERYAYAPYGATSILAPDGSPRASSAIHNPFLFQGRALDGTGLYYFRARHYDSDLGRFLQRDALRDGSSLGNLYAFAASNPFAYGDPYGQAPQWVDGAWNAVTGAVAGAVDWAMDTFAGEAMSMIGDALGLAGEAALEFGKGFLESAGDFWNTVSNPGDVLSGMWEALKTFAGDPLGTLEMLLDGAIKDISSIDWRSIARILGNLAFDGLVVLATVGVGAAAKGALKLGTKAAAAINESRRATNGVARTLATAQKAGACFAAGTLVWAIACLVPIEAVAVGQRVHAAVDAETATNASLDATWAACAAQEASAVAGHDPVPWQSGQSGQGLVDLAGPVAWENAACMPAAARDVPALRTPTADAATWSTGPPVGGELLRIELVLETEGGDCARVCALRTPAWLARHADRDGRLVWIVFPEIGLRGWARITGVTPARIEEGPGRVVTATIARVAAGLIQLEIGEDRLTVTRGHRCYSLDRGGWVPVGSLNEGERVAASGGPAPVTSVTPLPGSRPVYNLEVAGAHTYHVGTAGLVVHNDCGGAASGGRGLGAKAPDQVTPGVRQLEGQYVDDVGQVQPWRAQYDEYGRQMERTDFTDLPDPSTHTNPHHHTREYGPGYGPKGKETRHPGPGPSTGGGQ